MERFVCAQDEGCTWELTGNHQVCEPSVRSCDQHKSSGAGKGKEREWDGRGAGVIGWETELEEDTWKADLDFGGLPIDELDTHQDEYEDIENIEGAMSVGELMEWRYIKAEREKEKAWLHLSMTVSPNSSNVPIPGKHCIQTG